MKMKMHYVFLEARSKRMFWGTKNRGTLISCKDFLSLQTCITMNAFNRSSIQNITHIFVYRNIKICTDFVDMCIKLNTEQIRKCSVHLIWNTKFGTITASFGNGKQVQLQWTPGIQKWKLQTKIFLVVPML